MPLSPKKGLVYSHIKEVINNWYKLRRFNDIKVCGGDSKKPDLLYKAKRVLTGS